MAAESEENCVRNSNNTEKPYDQINKMIETQIVVKKVMPWEIELQSFFRQRGHLNSNAREKRLDDVTELCVQALQMKTNIEYSAILAAPLIADNYWDLNWCGEFGVHTALTNTLHR